MTIQVNTTNGGVSTYTDVKRIGVRDGVLRIEMFERGEINYPLLVIQCYKVL